MNLRGGWALIRKSLFQYMSSRGFFWTLALGWMMGPLVYLFAWTTAARQRAIGGFERGDFAFYYLCLIAVNQFTYPVSNWTVGDSIRFGRFSAWLLRPLPAVYEAIGTDVATKMVCMPFVLAMTVALGVVLRPSLAFSLPAVLAFVAALVLAQALRFLLAYVLALVTLWSHRADALLRLNDTLSFLFAGQVAPTALLPGALQRVATMLPYRYMVGFPIEVLMGRVSRAEMWVGFGWQVGWLAIALLLHQFVWRRGLRHYTAVGG
jgi:ABC-2 type transport system permease protein